MDLINSFNSSKMDSSLESTVGSFNTSYDPYLEYSEYNLSNLNSTNSSYSGAISWVYTKGIAVITLFCIISMIVNLRVLMCIRWIQGPLSKTLYISLSLAAADCFTSAIVCVSLIFNSYLYMVWNIEISPCILLAMEAFRLGGIVTAVMHLMLLACNHYLGIVRPLHYPNIMTHELTKACLTILWILPPVVFLLYFSLNPETGFQHEKCEAKFLEVFEFRIIYTQFLVVPFIGMTIIYTHILIIVRKKQNKWAGMEKRGTSCRHPGGRRTAHLPESSKKKVIHHAHTQQHCEVTSEQHRKQQRMQRNVKAVHTTLLILGSYVGGIIPPITVYLMYCANCNHDSSKVGETIFWFVNLLLVTKPLANPIIYAARMQEIKEATRRMRAAICHNGSCKLCSPLLPLCFLCCGCNTRASKPAGGGGGQIFGRKWARNDSRTDSQQLYCSGSSWRGNRTAVCRLISNGNTPHLTTAVGSNANTNTITFAEAGLPIPVPKRKSIGTELTSTVL